MEEVVKDRVGTVVVCSTFELYQGRFLMEHTCEKNVRGSKKSEELHVLFVHQYVHFLWNKLNYEGDKRGIGGEVSKKKRRLRND